MQIVMGNNQYQSRAGVRTTSSLFVVVYDKTRTDYVMRHRMLLFNDFR
jgi:hypothetical protein